MLQLVKYQKSGFQELSMLLSACSSMVTVYPNDDGSSSAINSENSSGKSHSSYSSTSNKYLHSKQSMTMSAVANKETNPATMQAHNCCLHHQNGIPVQYLQQCHPPPCFHRNGMLVRHTNINSLCF